MNENEIMKASKQALNTSSTNNQSYNSAGSKQRGKSSDNRKVNLSGEWIPTEAVRAISKIRE